MWGVTVDGTALTDGNWELFKQLKPVKKELSFQNVVGGDEADTVQIVNAGHNGQVLEVVITARLSN